MQIFPDIADRAGQAMSLMDGTSSRNGSGYPSGSQPFGDLMDSLAGAAGTDQRWSEDLGRQAQTMADHYAQTASTSAPSQDIEGGAAGLQVTREDFADLREDLKRYGLSEDDLVALEEEVASSGGITWRELMNKVSALAAKGSGESQSLDVETKRLLTGFLGRLGFSQAKTKEVVADLDEDKLDAAWQKIAARLAALSPEETVSVTRDEIAALAKAFNVPGTGEKALGALFAGKGSVELNVAGLQHMLLMLKQASVGPDAAAMKNVEASMKSLHDKLREAIGKAMERAERDELADNNETRSVANSKIRIKKAAEEHYGEASGRVSRPEGKGEEAAGSKHLFKEPVHEKAGEAGRAAADATRTGTGEGKAAEAVQQVAASDQTKAARNAENTGADELAAAKKASDEATNRFAKERTEAVGQAQDKAARVGSGNADAKSSGGDAQTRSDDGWSAFWNRVAKGEASAETPREFVSLVSKAGQAADTRANAAAERATQAFRREGSTAQETLRTLERAFMKNLGEGQRQLTLRLDPPQMGRVALLLTVKNNEVSAVLRTEKHETGQMIAEQLQQLRHSLEQQGLKVQKLDVQTQLNNDGNHQSWLGTDGHNMAREHSARQQTLQSWKQMRGPRESEAGLAHDVHNGNVQEQISQGGLHLIA